MNDNLALCLDGPMNGQYADRTNPPEDYHIYVWPTDEICLIHAELGYRGEDS